MEFKTHEELRSLEETNKYVLLYADYDNKRWIEIERPYLLNVLYRYKLVHKNDKAGLNHWIDKEVLSTDLLSKDKRKDTKVVELENEVRKLNSELILVKGKQLADTLKFTVDRLKHIKTNDTISELQEQLKEKDIVIKYLESREV